MNLNVENLKKFAVIFVIVEKYIMLYLNMMILSILLATMMICLKKKLIFGAISSAKIIW